MPDRRRNDGRKNTKSTRRADALLGYVIPIFFMALAAFQQITTGAIDKYVLGALLVIVLGALGWRLDTFFEKYVEMRQMILNPPAPKADEPEPPAKKKAEEDDETVA